jgi:uncharacterized protein YuzE
MSDKIEYDSDNRISYDKADDTLYIWKAPCQGKLGAVLLYHDPKDFTMVSLDTDEVGTIVGIEITNVLKIIKKFNTENN